jgi:hypothetical protein
MADRARPPETTRFGITRHRPTGPRVGSQPAGSGSVAASSSNDGVGAIEGHSLLNDQSAPQEPAGRSCSHLLRVLPGAQRHGGLLRVSKPAGRSPFSSVSQGGPRPLQLILERSSVSWLVPWWTRRTVVPWGNKGEPSWAEAPTGEYSDVAERIVACAGLLGCGRTYRQGPLSERGHCGRI